MWPECVAHTDAIDELTDLGITKLDRTNLNPRLVKVIRSVKFVENSRLDEKDNLTQMNQILPTCFWSGNRQRSEHIIASRNSKYAYQMVCGRNPNVDEVHFLSRTHIVLIPLILSTSLWCDQLNGIGVVLVIAQRGQMCILMTNKLDVCVSYLCPRTVSFPVSRNRVVFANSLPGNKTHNVTLVNMSLIHASSIDALGYTISHPCFSTQLSLDDLFSVCWKASFAIREA